MRAVARAGELWSRAVVRHYLAPPPPPPPKLAKYRLLRLPGGQPALSKSGRGRCGGSAALASEHAGLLA